MSMDEKKAWQAYLDGELSVSEASEFEENLSDGERERLAAEVHFENSLANHLSRDADCPEDVWKRTQALLTKKRALDRGSRRAPHRGPHGTYRRWYWGVATLAAAASLAFVVSLFSPLRHSPSPAVVLAVETVEQLAASSETERDQDSIQRYLDRHGVDLALRSPASLATNHKPIELLGARREHAKGEAVMEVLVACCGYPVKILMAQRGSAAAEEIGRAAGANGHVMATRVVGGYLTAVVGLHPAHGLLDLLASPDAQHARHPEGPAAASDNV